MNVKFSYILLITSILGAAVAAAARPVKGFVREQGGEPLPGAIVAWVGSRIAATTDTAGYFYMQQPKGASSIAVSYPGFYPDTLEITAATPDTLTINLQPERMLGELTVTARRHGVVKSRGLMNSSMLTSTELTRAACCNLGESFTTNPSVDVSYADAATGARQIKLLGLSGSYVQMLTENIPNFRGAAMPYALGYVPGPWMQSIQVSKGSSSVKNGYESITGQINVEFLKPQSEKAVNINLFGNTMTKLEANADANVHLSDRWSTAVLAHYEDRFADHDSNGDGFTDSPDVRQINAMNRWAYFSEHYIFQAAVKGLGEWRSAGQSAHNSHSGADLFRTEIDTRRFEAFAKNAYIFNSEKNSNVALILSGSLHDLDASFGHKSYQADQKNLYASLLFETDFSPAHNLSAGVSLNHDYYKEHIRTAHDPALAPELRRQAETVPGAYAQYTFNLRDKLVVMGGMRVDHSDIYGTFATPRAHIKFAPADWGSFRLSAGKGFRSVHALAENNFLMASGRRIIDNGNIQEAAWNYGASASFYVPLARRTLNINLEYYFTDFIRQTIIDYDSDPNEIRLAPLDGKSYSHTFQIDATYPVFKGATVTAAYRMNDVRTTYGGKLLEKPLTSRYKALLTASYSTPLEIWQFDLTFQLNGGGRMPAPRMNDDGTAAWPETFPAYQQLNAQVTRWFRHWSIYIGGENLTGYRQKNPVIGADNPWSTAFEPTLVWGPTDGPMGYLGLRFKF